MDTIINKALTLKYFTPAAITVAVVLWTFAVSPYSKYGDNWAVYPVIFAAPIILAWHIYLVIKPGTTSRINQTIYAVAHGSIFFVIFLYSLMLISKDSL